jgi:hypothetical protein
MKAAVWQRAVTAQVIPHLPGEWLATGYALIQAPVGHLARAVVRNPSSYGPSYELLVMVQPLYVEMEGWQGRSTIQLGRGRGQGYWPGFSTAAEGTESTARMVRLVESDALPYLTEYGTLEGFRRMCREAAAEHPSFGKVYLLQQQAATEVLLDEPGAALATLAEIRATADAVAGAPAWLTELAAQADAFRALVATDLPAAVRELGQVEERMRARLDIPGVG